MEVALFVEDVVVREQALRGDGDDAVVTEGDQRVGDMRRADIAEGRARVVARVTEGARATSSNPSLTTVPTRTGGTLSSNAISISATREASMKPSFNKRSSGGYPIRESSGVSTRSAPAEAAWVRKRPSVSTFCANPPTTAFI